MDEGSAWSYFADPALVVLGAALAWVGRSLADRGARKTAKAVRAESAVQRRYELGREYASALAGMAKTAWDELASRQVNLPALSIQSIDTKEFIRTGELIPNVDLRKAASAVGRLLADPMSFEASTEFVAFTLPKGPKGAAPPTVIELLAVESLSNMLLAFLREEDPVEFRNPLLDMVVAVGEGKGITVQNLYNQT